MNIVNIVYKNIKQRSLSSLLTILSVLLGVGLVTAILILKKESEEKFNQTAAGYEIIVGPKGSSLQLTLSTVYQIGMPVQNMPLKVYELLKDDRRVRNAVPYVFGDNYRNFRITGTVSDLLSEFEYKKGVRYNLENGSFFKNDFEAVIGKEVSEKTGLNAGDTFTGSHGIESYEGASEHSGKKFRVTGILNRTYTPSDRMIFVSMNSVWELHQREDEVTGNDEHQIVPDSTKTISAVLLKLKSPVFFDLMRGKINENKYEGINAQAVLPLFEIKQLFDIIGNINSIILVIAYLVIFTSAVSILVSIYNSMNERMREIAVMRSLGAGRFLIMKIIIFEGMFLSLTGAILGCFSGHIAVFLLEEKISALSGIKISGAVFSMFEIYLIAGTVILGMLVSFIPAVKAYRTDVSKILNS